MPRITTVQAAHTYGVLDPHVVERRDTKFINGSLSDGRNIVLLPQGGYSDRGGSTDRARVRRKLTSVFLDASNLVMPNGGSVAALLNGTQTTTAAAATNRFVVLQINFGVPVLLHMVDIRGLSIATTAAENSLFVEYFNGTSWLQFGAAQKTTLNSYSRRFASGEPGHAGVAATNFRIAVDATLAAGTVSLWGIALWVESGARSDNIVRRYAPEQGSAHQLVYTDRNVDVFERGVWRGSIPSPITEGILRKVKFEPKYDTILAFEQTMRPQQFVRLGNSAQWSCDPVVFSNMPRADYGGRYTNGINEIQEIQIYDASEGDTFELLFEGLATTSIQISNTTPPTTATQIKTALEGLSNVGPGVIVNKINDLRFTVEFADNQNSSKNVLVMTGTPLSGASMYIRIRTLQEGKAAGEDLMSDLRGWPAVGRYAQQRLIMGGLKSRPNDFLASVTGAPFDLNTEIDVATRAFSYEVDFSENNAIRDIVVGKTLMFFGDQQLAFLKNNVLSADEVPQFGVSDAPGIKTETTPVSSDNALFFIQEGGTTLRMTSYTELEQNFIAENASVLSAHLIRNPTDMYRRRARGAVDSDLMLMTNGDGTMTALTLMRTQEVSGFAPWTTDGKYQSGCTDHENKVWTLVERVINGAFETRLEEMEPDKLLDEAIELVQASSTTITGLSRYNGRIVYAVANDSVYGPHLVAGGAITVNEPVTAVRVGTWIAPLATDPDVSLTEETRQRMPRLKRVNRAEISVIGTTSIAIRANDGAIEDLALYSNDETILDIGPLARPFTGKVEAEGMHGFTEHGRLTITQTYPGRFTVRSVTKNVAA